MHPVASILTENNSSTAPFQHRLYYKGWGEMSQQLEKENSGGNLKMIKAENAFLN